MRGVRKVLDTVREAFEKGGQEFDVSDWKKYLESVLGMLNEAGMPKEAGEFLYENAMKSDGPKNLDEFLMGIESVMNMYIEKEMGGSKGGADPEILKMAYSAIDAMKREQFDSGKNDFDIKKWKDYVRWLINGYE